MDSKTSTEDIPVYSFDRVEKLKEGEIVSLDVVLSPVGLSYKAGKTPRIVVNSKDELKAKHPQVQFMMQQAAPMDLTDGLVEWQI